MKKLPKLRRFKARNLAFVHIDGGKRKLYLGKWGASETEAAYRRFIAELVVDALTASADLRQHARQLFPLRRQAGRRSRTRSSGNARRASNGSGAQTRQVDRPRSRARRIDPGPVSTRRFR